MEELLINHLIEINLHYKRPDGVTNTHRDWAKVIREHDAAIKANTGDTRQIARNSFWGL